MKRLQQAHVLVVGLGGVGAYAAEMICRAGVGRMTIVDADTVQPTNINRQLPALHSTIGKEKSAVLAARFKDINPDIQLAGDSRHIRRCFGGSRQAADGGEPHGQRAQRSGRFRHAQDKRKRPCGHCARGVGQPRQRQRIRCELRC